MGKSEFKRGADTTGAPVTEMALPGGYCLHMQDNGAEVSPSCEVWVGGERLYTGAPEPSLARLRRMYEERIAEAQAGVASVAHMMENLRVTKLPWTQRGHGSTAIATAEVHAGTAFALRFEESMRSMAVTGAGVAHRLYAEVGLPATPELARYHEAASKLAAEDWYGEQLELAGLTLTAGGDGRG